MGWTFATGYHVRLRARRAPDMEPAPRMIAFRHFALRRGSRLLLSDVDLVIQSGWRLGALRAFDAFPMTHHVECVATLVRR